MLLDDAQRLDAVARLADDLHAFDLAEEEAQLFSRKLFVVHDDNAEQVDRVHPGPYAIPLAGTRISGMTTRAQVPSPGTLSSCSW